MMLMMSCGWEEEQRASTCLQSTPSPLHMQLPARLFVFVLAQQWQREQGTGKVALVVVVQVQVRKFHMLAGVVAAAVLLSFG